MTAVPVPKGFLLSIASAGFKRSGKPDLSLVYSEIPAVAAGVFTTNLFKAAPVVIAMDTLDLGSPVRAVITNTGQANACTGEKGLADCKLSLEIVAHALGIKSTEILPASTGVIGARMKMELWKAAVPTLIAGMGAASVEELAAAMITTDAYPKYAAETLTIDGKQITLTGVAKGAGMICPTMATMISIVMCDAQVDHAAWRRMFQRATEKTFNRVTVDGDTSTNDTLYGLANGASGVEVVGENLKKLEEALIKVLDTLAYLLVKDGEGATKVIHINVTGAATDCDAEAAARAVGHSPLVKTAMYGKDPNWGRIVAALGRSGVMFDPMAVRVILCGLELFNNGQPTTDDFDALLEEPMNARDIMLDIVLGCGKGTYTLMASDLTHEYITINADYRS